VRDDRELVSRLKAGEPAAFDEAYARYHGALHSFLARLVRRKEIAEDLLQETWLRLATRAVHLRDDTHLEGWLLTVARNLGISFLRWRVLDGERLGALRGAGATGRGESSPLELTVASELEPRARDMIDRHLQGAERTAERSREVK
jgi:RNA polymerase sigma factor (sigma-70 family)